MPILQTMDLKLQSMKPFAALLALAPFLCSAETSLDWLETFEVSEPSFPDSRYTIEQFGAQPDNKEANTKAFRNAIQTCHESGGGTVVVPAGVWQTGPIELRSNVNLHLESGATIAFSDRFEDYLPVVLIQRGGYFCYNYAPPIYAKDCENIAITGAGVIDGQGQVWWPWKQNQPGMVELFEMGKRETPIEERIFGTPEDGVRPPFVQFIECKNALIDGVSFVNGPSWNLHPVWCENLVIRNVSIVSHGPNNDGIDIDGCRNVLIENCYLDVGDDNIALKSGRDEEAWRIGRPTENVVVRNCQTKAGHGGFVIGSEMSADVRNVLVENCHFDGTRRGIRFKSRLGRSGIVENVVLRNITMENIKGEAIIANLHYDAEPIERNMNYNSRAAGKKLEPTFRNIRISGVTCLSSQIGIYIRGLDTAPIESLVIEQVSIRSKEASLFENVSGLRLSGTALYSESPLSYRSVGTAKVEFENSTFTSNVNPKAN